MFVKSVRHVARSTCPSSAPPYLASRSSTPPITACQKHQRRQSSSKPSSAPGGSRGAEQAARSTSDAPTEGERRPAGRLTRRKSKDAAAELAIKAKDDGFVKVPAVPPTNHLNPQDVAISTFFSLHRPISVTTPIPPPTSLASFNSIFDPPKPVKATDVIFTLSNAVSILENNVDHPNSAPINKDFLREIIQEASFNTDPSKRLTLNMSPEQYAHQMQKLTQMFRPFNVPPEPRPFPDAFSRNEDGSEAAARPKADSRTRRRSRVSPSGLEPSSGVEEPVKTDLHVPEEAQERKQVMQHPRRQRQQFKVSGRTNVQATTVYRPVNYLASSPRSPSRVVNTKLPAKPPSEIVAPSAAPRRLNERSIFLISVKRQRKLKMKKHKYKKLMKRTRTVRKREGRL